MHTAARRDRLGNQERRKEQLQVTCAPLHHSALSDMT
jgi:hypothetical protein